MEPVYYSNKEFIEILQDIDDMIEEAEKSPFQQSKDLTKSILKHFDLVHREPLSRMMKMIENDYPDLRSKLETDYTIKTMFRLYDLIEGDIIKSPAAVSNNFIPVEDVGYFPTIINPKKS
jgi:hypothetical protein